MKKFYALTVAVLTLFASCGDEEIIPGKPDDNPGNQPGPNPPTFAIAEFADDSVGFVEQAGSAQRITIDLTETVREAGEIVIGVEAGAGQYGVRFKTSPEVQDNEIKLVAAPGTKTVSFTIEPLDDTKVLGNVSLKLTLKQASGSIKVKDNSFLKISIEDNELKGMSKRYETFSNSWRLAQEFEYREDGKIARIRLKQCTPACYFITKTYQYEGDKIVGFIEEGLAETRYTWQNDRIVKSERFVNGTLKQYTEYGYDDGGRVGEVIVYDRLTTGELARTLVSILLYHTDGNLYKRINYSPQPGSEELLLLSTHTFEFYISQENPVPAVDLLPTVKTQRHLFTKYTVEAGGKTLEYNFSYRNNAEGKLIERVATGAGNTETTFYQYY